MLVSLFSHVSSHCRYPTLSYRINDLLVSETTHAFFSCTPCRSPTSLDAHVFVSTCNLGTKIRPSLGPGLYVAIDILRLQALRYYINVHSRCPNNTSRSQQYYRVGNTRDLKVVRLQPLYAITVLHPGKILSLPRISKTKTLDTYIHIHRYFAHPHNDADHHRNRNITPPTQ
jgi:hypothetical protein